MLIEKTVFFPIPHTKLEKKKLLMVNGEKNCFFNKLHYNPKMDSLKYL